MILIPLVLIAVVIVCAVVGLAPIIVGVIALVAQIYGLLFIFALPFIWLRNLCERLETKPLRDYQRWKEKQDAKYHYVTDPSNPGRNILVRK